MKCFFTKKRGFKKTKKNHVLFFFIKKKEFFFLDVKRKRKINPVRLHGEQNGSV